MNLTRPKNAGSFFQSVRARLALLVAIPLFAVGLLVAMTERARVLEHAGHQEVAVAEDAHHAMFKANLLILEIDALVYEYHATPSEETRRAVNEAMVRMFAHLNEAKRFSRAAATDFAKLEQELTTFSAAFDSLAAKVAYRGVHPRDGLHGVFTQALAEFETQLEILAKGTPSVRAVVLSYLLSLRRAEQKIMITQAFTDTAEHASAVERVMLSVPLITMRNQSESDIINNLLLYQMSFGNWLATRIEEGELRRTLQSTKDQTVSYLARMLNEAEQAQAQVIAAVNAKQRFNTLLVRSVSVIAAALAILLGAIIGRFLHQSLHVTHVTMDRLAKADTSVDVPGLERKDEFGDMARALEVFRQSESERQRLSKISLRSAKAESERSKHLEGRIQQFEARVAESLHAMQSASASVAVVAEQVTYGAHVVCHEAQTAEASAAVAEREVTAAAAAVQQISSASQDVSRQAARSSTIANDAVTRAQTALTTIRSLASESGRISDVVNIINNIAAQTNLLALNATIEAARAGAAGRGFAVVAQEVKQLASATGRSTDQIAQQIATMQSTAESAVVEIVSVDRVLSELLELALNVSSAVEEQTRGISALSESIERAAAGSRDSASSIQKALGQTVEGRPGLDNLRTQAAELAEEGDRLQREVQMFLDEVRAA
jgi:methyl-accepting chemotaxis protein